MSAVCFEEDDVVVFLVVVVVTTITHIVATTTVFADVAIMSCDVAHFIFGVVTITVETADGVACRQFLQMLESGFPMKVLC